MATTLEALRRIGAGERGIEEAVGFAVGHRVRIEILAALHEGPASADGLSKIVKQPLNKVSYHLDELLKDGWIEVARTERIGNRFQDFYCVVKLAHFSDADTAAMSRRERQALAGLILQASLAEALASLWATKIRDDPRVMLAWNRITLDRQGREDLADEQAASWQRMEEIEGEAANRRAESEEPGVTFIITSFGYERSRTSAPEPLRESLSPENSEDSRRIKAKALAALRRIGKSERGIEDAVSYAIGHRIRIELLAALHEGPQSARVLAKTLKRRKSTVEHHLDELLKDGFIEIVGTERVGNLVQHLYCVVKLPFYTDEDVAAMSDEERQALAGLILQAAMAEALASLWAGKLRDDPRVMLAWNRITLDRQGRADLADEQARSWERMEEIEGEAANRRAESDDPGVTFIITSFGYERSRTSAPEPITDSTGREKLTDAHTPTDS